MEVSLTPELAQLVQRKVQTGLYGSASEVVREALRLMEERDQTKAIEKETIRKKIAAGVASAQAGRVSDGDLFMSQMIDEIEAEIRVGIINASTNATNDTCPAARTAAINRPQGR